MKNPTGREPSFPLQGKTASVTGPWVRVLVIGFILVTIGAHFYSISVLFQPGYGSRGEPEGALHLTQPDGTALAAIYLPNAGAKHTLWFFHGNAEDLGNLGPFLRTVQAHGYAVFACEYPGYGRSFAAPSEKAFYATTATAAHYLQDKLHVPLSTVVVYGRSLGGGPAVELAAHEPVAGLVLQSAFTSVYRVMTRWPLLPLDKFENLAKLPHVACPVLVMHGKLDGVVPFVHGEMLYAAAPGRKAAFWVDGAGHNNLLQVAGPRYWDELKKFTDPL